MNFGFLNLLSGKFLSEKDNFLLYHITQQDLIKIKRHTNNIKLYRFIGIFAGFIALIKLTYNKLASKVIMSHLELVVTTKCNLKCKGCSNLINLYGYGEYKDSHGISYGSLVEYVERLSKAVDYIYLVRLIIGETFLYLDLNIIIEKLLSINNIGGN